MPCGVCVIVITTPSHPERKANENKASLGSKSKDSKVAKMSKRTTPGIPTWSPTVVLTWPDSA
eukprot:scaffold17284_cov177-Skeletonema_dohrnii-CCMP3373.AAC.2